MAAYWTIEKDKDIEDVKTVKPFQEAKVGGNMAQYPPEDEDSAEIDDSALERRQCAERLNEFSQEQ